MVSAESVNTFKNCLDKFWSGQEVLYDYKADLHGIGNRSVIQCQKTFSIFEARLHTPTGAKTENAQRITVYF